jgi:hypothetical protein
MLSLIGDSASIDTILEHVFTLEAPAAYGAMAASSALL